MIDGKSFNTEEFKEEPLDPEIKKLVYLINQVDGVETTESCFGHHKMPCHIWLRIKNVDTANKFIRRFFYFDPLWSLKLSFSEASYFDELLFVIESAYQDYPTVDLMVENLTKRFLKALKQKPYEDSIVEWKKDFKGYVNSLSMPRDDYNGIMEYIDELPVKSEQKMGRWIYDGDQIICSKCKTAFGFLSTNLATNFCANCGAKMEVEE